MRWQSQLKSVAAKVEKRPFLPRFHGLFPSGLFSLPQFPLRKRPFPPRIKKFLDLSENLITALIALMGLKQKEGCLKGFFLAFISAFWTWLCNVKFSLDNEWPSLSTCKAEKRPRKLAEAIFAESLQRPPKSFSKWPTREPLLHSTHFAVIWLARTGKKVFSGIQRPEHLSLFSQRTENLRNYP